MLMLLRKFLAIALLLACSLDASAFHRGGKAGPVAPVAYVGPGDITTFTAWWGLRAYSSAQATGTVNIARIKRASDNTSTNIVALTNGQFDTATASTFCNATTCTVTALYDQVGTNNLTATNTKYPDLVFNCNGTYPCMKGQKATTTIKGTVNQTPTTGNGTQYLVGNTYVWASGGVVGMFYVNGGSVNCICMTHEQTANHWTLSNNAHFYPADQIDGQWHVGTAIANLPGADFDMAIDGVEKLPAIPFSNVSSSVGVTIMGFGDTTGVVGMETEEYGWVDNGPWSHGTSIATTCLIERNAGSFYGITIGGVC